jgi:hypothetical protein
MNIGERREHVLRILGRRNRYQFGQPPATCTLVGQSGCTDTCIQLVVLMAKGKSVSLNDVRRRSGAPADTPMNTAEATRALHSYGLPYEVMWNAKASTVVKIAQTKGPVIIAEKYWAHPQWMGYTYMGRTLRGKALNDSGRLVTVGLSHPLRRSGLTQWNYRDGHAVLLATDMYKDGAHWGIVRDSNHNSPSRPERPAYDMVTMAQLNRMLGSWYGTSLVLVPTRVVIK